VQAKRQQQRWRYWPIVLVGLSVAYAALVITGIVSKRRAIDAPYPLTTCIVSDRPMQRPHARLLKGRKVLFCCRGCVKRFRKDPEKYFAKLDRAYVEMEIEKGIENE